MTDADLALACRLADAAGEAIRHLFRAPFAIEAKPDASPVTQADRAAEAAMRAILEQERPADGIVGEEYGNSREGAERVWVLDPIDGTRSFIAGRPIFGTLIALMEAGRPVLGIIDQPVLRERWIGARYRPTTFNGTVATTRSRDALLGAALATTSPHLFDEEEVGRFLALVGTVSGGRPKQGPVYGGDCYNYGLLASGHLDLVVESGLKLYDFAALVPVVEGAGGRMCDWHGARLDAGSDGHVIAAGDPGLIEAVLDALG